MPLVLIGLGALVSFRAGYFNIGAVGQMYVGAIAATALGLGLEEAPAFLVVPLAVAAVRSSPVRCGPPSPDFSGSASAPTRS